MVSTDPTRGRWREQKSCVALGTPASSNAILSAPSTQFYYCNASLTPPQDTSRLLPLSVSIYTARKPFVSLHLHSLPPPHLSLSPNYTSHSFPSTPHSFITSTYHSLCCPPCVGRSLVPTAPSVASTSRVGHLALVLLDNASSASFDLNYACLVYPSLLIGFYCSSFHDPLSKCSVCLWCSNGSFGRAFHRLQANR